MRGLQNKPSCDRKEKLAWQRESAWSPRWEKCFSKWNALIGWFKSPCPWCSTSRFSEDRSAFEKAPFAPVNSCNKGSSWGLKPSESEQGLRLTALKTHECLLRSFGDTSGPLIRLPKAKIASSSLGDLDGQIWATANGQLATVISCQDAKDLVRTNKRCNQRSCLSNFFRGCSLRSCSLVSPPKLRPQVVFPPAGSLKCTR